MRIAVIGAGISGISAAFNLHDNHEVTLIDGEDAIGGHANTILASDESGNIKAIDTGFIVFNNRNYGQFCHFLEQLGVQKKPTDMSFSYTDESKGISYAGTKSGLIPGWNELYDIGRLMSIYQIYKYSRALKTALNSKFIEGLSIRQLLENLDCPLNTIEDYFIPLASAIWSCDSREVENIPAIAYGSFFSQHGLLDLFNRPKWYTVTGGSRTYLQKFESSFTGTINRRQRVISVEEHQNEVHVKNTFGVELRFDRVVLAVHADTALEICTNLSGSKQNILEKHKYTKNQVVLHTDLSLMPKTRRVWASWNVMKNQKTETLSEMYTTYYMNRLQRIESNTNFLVTVNPPFRPKESAIIYETNYSHPMLTQRFESNQNDFSQLNADSKILFCGAYLGYGFHEDGYSSGKRISEILNFDGK